MPWASPKNSNPTQTRCLSLQTGMDLLGVHFSLLPFDFGHLHFGTCHSTFGRLRSWWVWVRVLREKSRWSHDRCQGEVPCIHLYFAFKPRQKPRRCPSLGRPSCIWSLGRYRYDVLRGSTKPPTKHRQFDGATASMLLFEGAVLSAEEDVSQSSFD